MSAEPQVKKRQTEVRQTRQTHRVVITPDGVTIDGTDFSVSVEKPLFGKLVVTGIEEETAPDE